MRLAAAALLLAACSSIEVVRLRPENVDVGPGLKAIAAIEATVSTAYVLFVPIPGGVSLERVVNAKLLAAARSIGADKVVGVHVENECPAFCLSRLLGAVTARASGIAVQVITGDLGRKTVVVFRHAEAEPESAGPQRQLTGRGQERALAMAQLLGDTAVTTIYTTKLARTRLTAEPLARARNVPLVELEDVTATMTAVAAAPWGSTLVVVGHSNTVPQIVAGLSGQPFPAGLAVTHDQMWVVTLDRGGSASTLRLSYGGPDVPAPSP